MEGPRSILAGKVISVLTRSRTAITEIPISLNGNSSNQIKGYATKASIAIGQHKRNKIIHNINVVMLYLQVFTIFDVRWIYLFNEEKD